MKRKFQVVRTNGLLDDVIEADGFEINLGVLILYMHICGNVTEKIRAYSPQTWSEVREVEEQ